jgi:hypothetical protein
VIAVDENGHGIIRECLCGSDYYHDGDESSDRVCRECGVVLCLYCPCVMPGEWDWGDPYCEPCADELGVEDCYSDW